MDSREVKFPRYMVFCVVASCIGSFSNGWTIGSPNIPGEATYGCPNGAAYVNSPLLPDCLPMNSLLWGIAVSTFCLGGLVASFSASYFLTKFGRVNTIMYTNIGWILGSLLMAFAVTPAMFAAGRFFSGMSCGMGSVATPTYNGEISTIKGRGTMGTLNQLFIVMGILLSNLIGLGLNTVPLWRINYGLVIIPAIIQLVIMKFCVESPRYLVSVNDIDGSRLALQKLRGMKTDVENELSDIIEGQRSTATLKPPSVMNKDIKANDALDYSIDTIPVETSKKAYGIVDLFLDPVVRKITLIVVTLHAVQQFSAVNGVMYYSTIIFKEAFDSKTSIYMAISTSGVNLIVTLISVYLMDKTGRKVLLIIAQVGGCLAAFLLAIAGLFNLSALLVASVFLFVTFFAIGLGPIPWLFTSEVAPTHAASAMTAVATGINWGCNFLVALVFPGLMSHLHSTAFFIFGSILFASAIFTVYYVPETRNKSIEEINAMFERSIRSKAPKQDTCNRV